MGCKKESYRDITKKFPSQGIIIVFATDISACWKRKKGLPQKASNITKQLWNNLLQIRDQTMIPRLRNRAKDCQLCVFFLVSPQCYKVCVRENLDRQNKNAAKYFKDFITLQE